MYSGLTNLSFYTGTLYFYWFPHVLRTLNFYDFPLVLKTFLRYFLCTGDFEALQTFLLYWGLWTFTDFTLHWGLWVFIFSLVLKTLVLRGFPCNGYFEYLQTPPYTEDFESPRKCRRSLKIEFFFTRYLLTGNVEYPLTEKIGRVPTTPHSDCGGGTVSWQLR